MMTNATLTLPKSGKTLMQKSIKFQKSQKYLVVSGILILFCILGIAIAKGERTHSSWRLDNVSGYLPDLKFSLIADTGQNVTEQTYQGKIVLLYFGFTQCPDLCPLTMSRMAGVFKQMGKDADAIRVLFVTVDPAHDTASVLHDYLKSIDPNHMTGLTGPGNAISNLAKRYRAVYQPASGQAQIMHSDTVYIFDKDGKARLLATGTDKNADVMEDLRHLVHAEP
jgi:protein SCO1/2